MRRMLGVALGALGALALAASLAPSTPIAQAPLAAADAPVATQPIPTDIATPAPTLAPDAAPAGLAAATALPDGWRVSVPRLGIDLPLRDGDLGRDIADQATPVNAAFRLPGSASPGTAGNLYVYAHARTGMFLSLWSARPGDIVRLASPGGAILTYVVTEVAPRVAVTDIRYLLPTSDERLTLQTSTGPHIGDPRFVVVAMPQRR